MVIAGGSGFMGKALAAFYVQQKYEVVILSRKVREIQAGCRFVYWDGVTEGSWCKELDNAQLLINLSGKSVNCRYNAKNKQAIFDSRLNSTMVLGNYLVHHKTDIKVWMNAASATIYRHSLDKPMTESNGEIGEGFSVEVCKAWEKTFFEFEIPGIRLVALRTSIVLGENGGVMVPFKRLSRFGMGGSMGNGKQMFSWIHINDFCRIVSFVEQHKSIAGAINVASPNPVRNKELMRLLRKKYAPLGVGIPQPLWLLKFGAWLIRTEIELIAKSRFVIPERLLQEGFIFECSALDKAL